MSEITIIIDTLEARIEKLISRNKNLEQKLAAIESEKNDSVTIINNQANEIEALKSQIETLRIANSLLGSDENKRDTKLKINSLIREIDYCIAQLAD